MRIVFGKQLTFGFDDQDQRASREIVSGVDRHASEGDPIRLSALVSAAHRPLDISKDHAIRLIADLVRDDQLRLATDTKTMDKVASLSLLSRPDQWQDAILVRASVVDPLALANARRAAGTIFGAPAPTEQNELCRWTRKRLRDWINTIASYQRLSNATDYPGKMEMAAIVAITDRLLVIHDPCMFLEALDNQAGQLAELANRFTAIRRFYNDCGHIWQALVSAMIEFEENAAELSKNPRCRDDFGRIRSLFLCAQPFAAEPAILDTIAHVRSIHRLIIRRQVQAAARGARSKIDVMLDELRGALERAGAQSRLRNQVLYPLQRLCRSLDAATSAAGVAALLSAARDMFDASLDRIESSPSDPGPLPKHPDRFP